jgi:uncharacterized Zn-finger protein
MTCPYCDERHPIRALHAHLVDAHPHEIGIEEHGDRQVYVVTCPSCGQRYRHPIKKTAGDADFLVEFDHQIRLVAFDMLINHLLAEHDPELSAP